jgi:peptide/nickel transport system substrate-binding protein
VCAAAWGCGRAPVPKANEVRVAVYSEPASLSLIGNPDLNSQQLAALISDGLVGCDARGAYVPLIAASWEISADGLAIVFRLREGARWHDGAPVTARDVAFTVRKIQDPATQSRSWASAFADVVAVDTPDDRTVVVRYRHPYADALNAWRAPLVPEHAAAKDVDFLGGAFARSPIGCGPFRFVRRAPGQSIELAAFDGYWGGKPPIDRLVVRILASDRTGYEALLLGEIDLLAVTPDLWRESLTSTRAARLARFIYYRLSGWKIDWNMDGSNPFFVDAAVRRALVMSLDRKRFAATVAGGLARPGVSSYPPESPWSNPALAPLPFDPVASARLLDASGWILPPGGRVRVKNGEPFAFALYVAAGSQEITDRIAAWVQQSFAEIGVAMSIEKVDVRALAERRKQHAFQAVMASNTFDPIADQLELYHSSARTGGLNYGGFSDPEVDRLLEEGRTVVDPAARRAIYDALQERLTELQPISYIFQFAQPVLHDPDLLGIERSSAGLFQSVPGPRAWHWAPAHAGP